jgi:hypothetical protein
MDATDGVIKDLPDIGISIAVLVGCGALLYLLHRYLLASSGNQPGRKYFRQLIMLCMYPLTAVVAIFLMPLSYELQVQLLGYLGILLGATIALSSIAIVGNVIAGLMLKALRNYQHGECIQVGELFGQITNMDLLQIEIRTDAGDLIALPNLFLVSNPVQRMPASGTILHVEISIGYDVPRQQVEAALLAAAKATGLEQPFVEIARLGDALVCYRVAGRLRTIERRTATLGQLRANVLDELHASAIDMPVSGSAANRIVQSGARGNLADPAVAVADKVAPDFGSASRDTGAAGNSAALNKLKKDYTEMSQQLIEVERQLQEAGPGEQRQPLNLQKKKLEAQLLRTDKEISALQRG